VVKKLTPNKSRVMCEGNYMGGVVRLRIDKNSSSEKVHDFLRSLKEDIQYIQQQFVSFYPNQNISFVSFTTVVNLSHRVIFRVGNENKEVSYRLDRKFLDESLHSFFINEKNLSAIKGEFKIGEKQFISLMNEHKGKQIHIEILNNKAPQTPIDREMTIQQNKERLQRFSNGFQNKSNIDTNQIVREVRGKK
jgi:hypothetical protein